MGPDLNISGALEYVVRAYEALGADRVAGIAPGNEPDVYDRDFNITYTIEEYVSAAEALADSIIEALGLFSERIFEVLDLAGSGDPDTNFTVEAAFEDALDSSGNTKYAAQDWYQVPTDLEVFTPETMQTYS